jgi:alpha-L-fucosidase
MNRIPALGLALSLFFALIGLPTRLLAQTDTPGTASASAQSVNPHAQETPAQRNARMRWWRQARFGLFIHWGLYAQFAGDYDGKPVSGLGEWIMHTAHIPVAVYAAQAKNFDPTAFNAETWVAIAKAAGMKYIVMTAKHHEGFAMFHSHVDGYNIWDATPLRRDPIAEMAAACKKAGIKFGVYYSQNLDWHHAGGGTAGPPWDPAQVGDFDSYVKNVAAPQVRELLTEYHPAVLWWDIPGQFTPEEVRALTAAFPADPGLITNNRLGGGVPGDYQTPEQRIPANGYPGQDWETCMTINNTWGYKKDDTDFKSSQTLLHNLIDIVSKGGNYLLNVGPDPTGVIPAPEVQRLADMGAWLKVNGDSVYGTQGSPFKHLPFDGRCTVKGRTLFLNVFSWPDSGLTLSGLETPVRGARALATGQKLTVTKAADGTWAISRPAVLDPLSTAVALTLSGPPVVSQAVFTIAPQPTGGYVLAASDAVLNGNAIQLEGNHSLNIGYWTDAGDTAQWTVSVPTARAGRYTVQMDYACDPASAGSSFALQTDGVDSGVTGTVQKTASWTDFQSAPLDGTLTLTPGVHVLRILPLTKPGLAVMNLRRLLLTPAP